MFVERCDFITSTGERVRTVITDLGILRKIDHELVLRAVHPGVTPDLVRRQTGWSLEVAAALETTPQPSGEELSSLRSLTEA